MRKRRKERFSPQDYKDYLVQVDWEELVLEAELINISDEGLCFAFEKDVLEEQDFLVEGRILEKFSQNCMVFTGKIVWKRKEETSGKTIILHGVLFSKPVKLSPTLFSLSSFE